MLRPTIALLFSAVALGFVAGLPTANAAETLEHKGAERSRLLLPMMDPVRGRALFGSKGCVVCHSVNGVGGEDAPAFDVKKMAPAMDPFDFVAKMWRGAEPMIAMQKTELGKQAEFTGQELADIIAFLHNRDEQKKFSVRDIPARIRKLMKED